MDPELRAYLDDMRRESSERSDAMEQRLRAEIRAGDEATRGSIMAHVDVRLDAHGQAMRNALSSMEAHIEESIQARKEDVDAAFKDIEVLRSRVRRLEQRMSVIEEGRG